MSSSRVFELMSDLGWSRLHAHPVKLADQLVGLAQTTLPVTGAGLALMSQGVPGALAAATDEPARRLEELQFTLGEGPCTRSAATGRPVLVHDLVRAGSAWPAFTAGAVEAGVAAVFALLRARAFADHRPLADVARDILTGTVSSSDDTAPPTT